MPAATPPTAPVPSIAGLLRKLSSSGPDSDLRAEFLGQLVEEALAATSAEYVALALLTPDRQHLEVTAIAGGDPDIFVGMRLLPEDSMAAEALRTGRTTVHPDFAAMPTGVPAGPATYRCAIIAPFSRGDQPAGALLALSRREQHVFHAGEAEAVEALAALATTALELHELRARERQQARELDALHSVARLASGSLDVERIFEALLGSIELQLRPRSIALFLLNDEKTHLILAAHRGLAPEQVEVQLSVESQLASGPLRGGSPVLMARPDIEQELGYLDTDPPLNSVMVAPLQSRRDALGLVVVTATESNAYADTDAQLLSTILSQCSAAIDSAFLFDDLARRSQETEALYRLSRELADTRNPDRIMACVADGVEMLVQADAIAILLANAQTGVLEVKLTRAAPAAFETLSFRRGEGIPGWVFEWMTPLSVTDVAEDARNASAPLDAWGISSVLAVPVASNRQNMGVLLAMSAQRRIFSDREVQLLDTIANHSAVSIENAILFRDARRRTQTMRRYFRRVAQTLGRELLAGHVPDTIAELVMEMMEADRCALYAMRDDELELRASRGFRAAGCPDASIPVGQGLTGWVARRGRPLAVECIPEDPRHHSHPCLSRDHVSSYLGVPLKVKRKTVGVLEVYSVEPRVYSEAETELLNEFARHAQVGGRLTEQ